MPSYMQNLKGTIRKVKGADPLPVMDPTEQKNSQFRRGAFVALRVGFSKRVHVERLVQQVHAFRAAQQKDATLSIVTPPNEAQQIAVVKAIEGVPTLRAADVAEASKLLADAAEVTKEGGNESS